MIAARHSVKPISTNLVSSEHCNHKNIDYTLLIERYIAKFLEFYRDSFPHASVLPKMHLLEDHLVPFLKEYGVGLGFLGEQGAESIHARFNEIKKNFSNMPNSVQRFECVLKEHFRQICPQNLSKQPEPKHYVTKRMRNSL